MSDNDMLRRGDVLKAVDMWESDWPCTYSAILALPAVQPDAGPKPFDCECGQVGPCKAPFCTPRSAQPHVNEKQKSEHVLGDVLTPATKGAAHD